MGRRWLLGAVIGTALVAIAPVAGSARQAPPPGYAEAESAFQSAFSVEQRVILQVLMTAAGYWNAVPNEDYSRRLFKAVQRFQAENGFAPTGVVDRAQIDRLVAIARPMLDLWGFRKTRHPSRHVTIWVPFGLGLRATRNEFGVGYIDPQKRVSIDFTTVPNVPVATNFAALLAAILQDGATIHYKVIKDGWFVISATTPDGTDHYLRYHQDGANVTGFTLSWNNANGNVSGERIAVLMSASLWSDMTGAAFVDPPSAGPALAAHPTPAPAPDQDVRPGAPPPPKAGGKISTGTGFFVAEDGSFVTNAHVVEGCSTVRVKTDDGAIVGARIAAEDQSNDLALLKLPKTPVGVARLRAGVRLGEGVAAFGFPHADMLSSSGNFTLGNVTALSGMSDDSRYLQISAPVQSGNSGGPLLDMSGNLVGVVTAKLNALKVAQRDGDLPQNVNFAVKATILATFLDSNRVALQAGSVASKRLDPADIADQARAMSGFVMCR